MREIPVPKGHQAFHSVWFRDRFVVGIRSVVGHSRPTTVYMTDGTRTAKAPRATRTMRGLHTARGPYDYYPVLYEDATDLWCCWRGYRFSWLEKTKIRIATPTARSKWVKEEEFTLDLLDDDEYDGYSAAGDSVVVMRVAHFVKPLEGLLAAGPKRVKAVRNAHWPETTKEEADLPLEQRPKYREFVVSYRDSKEDKVMDFGFIPRRFALSTDEQTCLVQGDDRVVIFDLF